MLPLWLMATALMVPRTASVMITECGADTTGKTDSTQAINACLAATPAGDVIVPAGVFKVMGTITKSRKQNLIGMGAAASTLECQAAYAPCVVVADTGSPTAYLESRIEDLTIQGPGADNTSIGVFIGGDPNGVFSPAGAYGESADFVGVRVTGFNHGIEWGNNSWSNKIVRSRIFGNATGLYVPKGLGDSGEGIGITDSVIFNNGQFGLDDHGNFEWMIQGSAFDYNGVAIEMFGSTIHVVNCHFEQSNAPVVFQPYGMAVLSIRDSEILVQANQGSDEYVLSTWPQYLNVTINDVSGWSNHPVQYFMRVQGAVVGTVTNLYANGNRKIGKLSDKVSAATMTAVTAF
jgi:hypothetical protein